MSRYYLCDYNIALHQCKGCEFSAVHYSINNEEYRSSGVWLGWMDARELNYHSQYGWRNAVLLKDVDAHIQTVLLLADPTFTEYKIEDIQHSGLATNLMSWAIL